MKLKWELRENEKLLGSADASYIKMILGIIPKPNPGKLHITDQRVLFTEPLSVGIHFEFPLDQIVSFSAGMSGITLVTTDGKKYRLTGMFNKKLASTLEQAGVKKV